MCYEFNIFNKTAFCLDGMELVYFFMSNDSDVETTTSLDGHIELSENWLRSGNSYVTSLELKAVKIQRCRGIQWQKQFINLSPVVTWNEVSFRSIVLNDY